MLAGIMAALCIKVVENAYLYSTGTDLSMRICLCLCTDLSMSMSMPMHGFVYAYLSMSLIDLIDKSVGDRDHLATSRHVKMLRRGLF